ncbi:hypothetical protein [Granulosicoccus antarcticus]|uniref:Uncharacterized protein n=1 Tax=Granulosicoccus antarcticus IMCC3135 TaxID=1192854 RepID=A0A2Z2P0C8_9GAMM|nr:hypothetical protein [Granulosicoccus antarcticus]ASJ75538.1 hypothetical protein IMCC3135_27420 [Granulosicoccus antarcticus IMCC3135]
MENDEAVNNLDAIDSIEEVQHTALSTLSEMLRSFFEHIPFLLGHVIN